MDAITMVNVSKEFRRYKKREGFLGTFQNFFNREYEAISAVTDMNISIKRGEIVGLLGPNGAGKTTIIKMLSGLLYPSSGDIKVLQYNPFKKEEAFKKKISIVLGQKQQLWWDIPAIESFRLNKEIYEIEDEKYKDILNTLVDMLNIKDLINVPVRNLSLGERMKCELVAALLHTPEVLYLDEPTIGLDMIAQKKIRDFIKEYNKRFNATIILTSHYIEDIEKLCERTIFINNGKKYYDGSLDDFLNLYAKDCILNIEYLSKDNDFKFDVYGDIVKEKENLCRLKVPKDQVDNIKQELIRHQFINSITVNQLDSADIIRNSFEKERKEI
ncbi:putative ABC transporter ATP-binding protein YbhF [Clostridium tepidiprofundi DSM 19306]|uniref:Putative ABC transporter ATP-binding protein YbhF n=1 Tax=Clostridium tepidiprofundi DSM 19306 TaxID=1121338 RepID=A0A151B2W1_9CLOT|nr:ATP-binding cassette domain-containing protein [Clostridium tepidiprofundi]KYH34245.1 putative ABC transporter ATP-binding protein YbhF [Clostridium tepidiprofundi DSM 19306]